MWQSHLRLSRLGFWFLWLKHTWCWVLETSSSLYLVRTQFEIFFFQEKRQRQGLKYWRKIEFYDGDWSCKLQDTVLMSPTLQILTTGNHNLSEMHDSVGMSSTENNWQSFSECMRLQGCMKFNWDLLLCCLCCSVFCVYQPQHQALVSRLIKERNSNTATKVITTEIKAMLKLKG